MLNGGGAVDLESKLVGDTSTGLLVGHVLAVVTVSMIMSMVVAIAALLGDRLNVGSGRVLEIVLVAFKLGGEVL